ncbi:transposase, IS116/IS110/IS902 domain protein [Leptospira interrogans str. FPW1039]|uniref:Transposase, IS116/IS110/IS902 domain protein n=1 Tax=Leptospira interrogans str. FPW1039 TaxID=1193040 RepID=A0A0F6I8W3_LEPIR|nr:transposase, IS116/IS110/IS902 domain protein [Leptospira interrogans serovar Hebdomadis str. R499]EKR84612.1 transposase, IS116/IS110/IS902 domain protein [Leptospira interrogans str. UI 08452]EMJ34488.1 transposase, IS116/IS110/IS902 domain protein [Leptospira interrogans str. FPW1039]EMN35064.1 transposase, IS116/IS110/IS902 domain protein [Leptospira interrogans serovar Medanensis str. L0448]EMN41984.1 transposase, IS116/IS110/IS902 domain protein [Leptospira interrogans str. L0996]EMN9
MFLLCEVCDFKRFKTAGSFMSFLGLVPGEYSSGSKRKQTGITKTGSPRHFDGGGLAASLSWNGK